MSKIKLIVFAKAPVPGFAKTRLAPALGDIGAAALAKRLLISCIEQCERANVGQIELHVTPSTDHTAWCNINLPPGIVLRDQSEGDLGTRLAYAVNTAIHSGYVPILMGTDCPGLTSGVIQQAVEALAQCDACIVPVSDGGYALLGLTKFHNSLFTDIPWSTDKVADITKQRLIKIDYTFTELPLLHDIDNPEDLKHLPASFLT